MNLRAASLLLVGLAVVPAVGAQTAENAEAIYYNGNILTGVDLTGLHPQRVKAIASAKLKNDRVDSETLAHLLRCDLLPESWKADRETQAQRQQVRLRANLVRQRTRLKNQVHAVLHQQGLRSPVTDVFGRRGRRWLAEVKLPPVARESVQACLRMIDHYSEEVEKQNLPI